MEVGLLVGVEVVARVERVVAVELVDGAVDVVGAGLGQHVDLAAGVAAELGAVGVRLDAELADRSVPSAVPAALPAGPLVKSFCSVPSSR